MEPVSHQVQNEVIAPLLASLPAAAASSDPPGALLPLLSPILRQRVQLLSSASSDPWLSLLTYDTSKASKLEILVKSERLEAHPVSGEVEVDWDEASITYKRVDEETLQSLVSLPDLGLSIHMIWCANDEVGGGDGWRVGELGILDESTATWGLPSIPAAEASFKTTSERLGAVPDLLAPNDDGDEDDDYWNQYDKTPGERTPAPAFSPAPVISKEGDEDDYYAQYSSVQPAMDNHDPDEQQQQGDFESSLGRDEIAKHLQSSLNADAKLNGTWSASTYNEPASGIIQPRPSSSNSSETVERLERRAEASDSSELGIKQHIGTSIKSLYRLAKVAGIEKDEFEGIVKRELTMLALMDEDD